MARQNLQSIQFNFSDGWVVYWTPQGRGVINGREYPSTYEIGVTFNGEAIFSKSTSLNPNNGNACDFKIEGIKFLKSLPVS